jgi:transposase-like protein
MQSESPSNEIVPAVAPTVVTAAQIAPRDLPLPQITALEALLAGSSVTDAAAAAGVDRSTLHNWLRKNIAFQAALNAGRKDLRRAIAHRLERLANDATECVGKAVREGDVKAALEIVKRLDVFAPRYLGSDDPDELAVDEAERQQQLLERGQRSEDRVQRLRDTNTLRRLLPR